LPLARADVRALGNLVGGCCTSGYECVNHALLAGSNREARDPAARLAAEKIDAVFEEVVRQRAGLRARTPSSCLGACRGGQSQSQCESVTLGTHMCAQTASRLSTHCVVNVGSVQPLYLVDGFATCRRGSGKGPHHLGVLQLVLQRGALEIACMRASVTQTSHTLCTPCRLVCKWKLMGTQDTPPGLGEVHWSGPAGPPRCVLVMHPCMECRHCGRPRLSLNSPPQRIDLKKSASGCRTYIDAHDGAAAVLQLQADAGAVLGLLHCANMGWF